VPLERMPLTGLTRPVSVSLSRPFLPPRHFSLHAPAFPLSDTYSLCTLSVLCELAFASGVDDSLSWGLCPFPPVYFPLDVLAPLPLLARDFREDALELASEFYAFLSCPNPGSQARRALLFGPPTFSVPVPTSGAVPRFFGGHRQSEGCGIAFQGLPPLNERFFEGFPGCFPLTGWIFFSFRRGLLRP